MAATLEYLDERRAHFRPPDLEVDSVLSGRDTYFYWGHPDIDHFTPPGLHGLFLATKRMRANGLTHEVSAHAHAGHIGRFIASEVNLLPQSVKPMFAGVLAEEESILQMDRFMETMTALSKEIFPTPKWIQNNPKFLIQMMPDRYFNPNLWSSDPEMRQYVRAGWQEVQGRRYRHFADNDRFVGGNFEGINDQLDHLQKFASAVYLTPIYESHTIHGYGTHDYFMVRPELAGYPYHEFQDGDQEKKEEIKKEGIKQVAKLADNIPVVLDIAINHAGEDFFAFRDIREKGARSIYRDWYQGLRFNEDGSFAGFGGWWDFALPQFNHHHYAVRSYFLGEDYRIGKKREHQLDIWKKLVETLQDPNTRSEILDYPERLEDAQRSLGVIGFWSALGIKGWRLDVPNNVNRREFWGEFRQLVKAIDPEIWIAGEIWDRDNEEEWLNGGEFDAIMNYRFWQWTMDFLVGPIEKRKRHISEKGASFANSFEFAERVNWFVERHPEQVVRAMMNVAGSHDVPRIDDLVGDKADLFFTIMATLPGVMSVWAGDELGMTNYDGEILDPSNRKPLAWDLSKESPSETEHPRLSKLEFLASLREAHPALRSGKINFIDTGDSDVLAYERREHGDSGADIVQIFVNRSNVPKAVQLTHNGTMIMHFRGSASPVTSGEGMVIELPPSSDVILTAA